MINRYIYAVTQKLPEDQRHDIADELRSLIEDMLDEQADSSLAKDKQIEEVLLQLGDPNKLADQYRGTKRYLIGPDLYDTYFLTLKIVFIVISVMIGIGFIIQTIINPTSILNYFVDMIVSIVTTLPVVFGWTTLAFALGQHYGGFKQQNRDKWHPNDLQSVPNKQRQIKRSDPIFSIVIQSIMIVLLMFSRQHFGVWVSKENHFEVIPFLNEHISNVSILMIIIILGLGILKECIKLVTGKWTYNIVVFITMINIVSLAAVLLVINSPNFWNPHFMNELIDSGLVNIHSDAFRVISTIWDKSTFWIFILIIVGLAWEMIDGLIRARKR